MVAALSLAALLAAAPDPAAALRDADASLRAALEAGAGREELARLAADRVDYRELARRSLGRHWSRLPERDRERVVAALRALLEGTYLPRLAPGARWTLALRPARQAGRDAEVQAVATSGGQQVPLAFRLRHGDDGRWRIYDATVGGLALLEGYQEQLPQLLQLGGVPKLVATLDAQRRALQRPPVAGAPAAP